MNFIIHEIKLWFNDNKLPPKSYEFLPNKINVITGDATTGKSSFWSIIDYCLLASKINIANTINEKVKWFGLRFTINKQEISIARKAPDKGVVSSDISFHLNTSFPNELKANKAIAEVKAFLDKEFGISDELRFPLGKNIGTTNFNLSYRYFLLFNSLTETVISAPETFFDTTFYGKEEYEKALNHIFDLVIGVNDMESMKATERIQEIDKELKKIRTQKNKNERNFKDYENNIKKLIDKCKKYNFIEYSETFETVDEAIFEIQEVIKNINKRAENQKLFLEIDSLYNSKKELQSQISTIKRYQKEYNLYKKNLEKSADSLQPIEFLENKLSDQLLESYETRSFIESLKFSLEEIKKSIVRKPKPIQVSGDLNLLQKKIESINKELTRLNELKKKDQTEGERYIAIGEIKQTLKQIEDSKNQKPIDTIKLNSLNDERKLLEKIPKDTKKIKDLMLQQLDSSIQRNYNQLSSLPTYKDHLTKFDSDEMVLKLYPQGEIFALDNVGSKSNYMFMHLCFYLGLHEHMINMEQEHVPQFLFIDQPSIPYFSSDSKEGNDDKIKLIDAFKLLNSFIEYMITVNRVNFQIIMVEHADKSFWEDNNLTHFHTVDEFVKGKGLIPAKIYNS
ncbi:DUF3732 domain-containing protein [Weeksellaceae bacterium TAE3-ERU29]|nr:DUF3732 domain-containing protein [Weeksellaceae bacterium TAE3-ERU29]